MISIEPIAENNPAPAFAIYKQAMRESTEAARGEPWTEDREYHQFCNQWQIETSHWIMHNQQRVGFLGVLKVNTRARTLYERHGFRAVGQKKHHVQMRWMESK